MWFRQIIREESGCASYMIGSENGDCLVFDPLWDIRPYLELAEKKGARIRWAIDSHTHADHVSGARRLAAATGAELILPEGAEAEFETGRIAGGDRIELGEVLLEAVHVPGHRPEQINLLVTDRSRGDAPWCLLTADFILVGDIARPDLAQGGEAGAGEIFDRALPRIAGLPDFVEVYPGHVAGSTCGRVTSGKHTTTLGYERSFNPALAIAEREAFVRFLNQGQPSRPANVENIVRINQGRLPYAYELPEMVPLTAEALSTGLSAGTVLPIDTRDSSAYGAGHVPGSVNIQLAEGQFEQRVGWVLPDDLSIVLVSAQDGDAGFALSKLAFVGLERRVMGYLAGGVRAWEAGGRVLGRLLQLPPDSVAEWVAANGTRPLLLDVREADEWEAGHLAGAVQTSYKDLARDLAPEKLDADQPVIVYCAGGNRSSTAAGLLARGGFRQVHNLAGGLDAWIEHGYPVE